MADGPQIDGVKLTKLLYAARRQRFTRLEIALAAPIEVLRFVFEVVELGGGSQDLEGLRRHFRASAVAGDDGDFERICHRYILCARGFDCRRNAEFIGGWKGSQG